VIKDFEHDADHINLIAPFIAPYEFAQFTITSGAQHDGTPFIKIDFGFGDSLTVVGVAQLDNSDFTTPFF
jgi:hypothetical protein